MSNVPPGTSPRRPWAAPRVTDLPPLTQLTLQTGIPGGMIHGGGVFSLIAAAAVGGLAEAQP